MASVNFVRRNTHQRHTAAAKLSMRLRRMQV